MPPGLIVALDLGTKLGYARSDGSSGSVNLKPDDERFLRFMRWLAQNVPKGSTVYYEDVKRHIGTTAAHVYGGFRAVLFAYCRENGIPYHPVGVGTIKKSWTGRGNAKKPEMMAEARKRGHAPKDDNQADALALLDYALRLR